MAGNKRGRRKFPGGRRGPLPAAAADSQIRGLRIHHWTPEGEAAAAGTAGRWARRAPSSPPGKKLVPAGPGTCSPRLFLSTFPDKATQVHTNPDSAPAPPALSDLLPAPAKLPDAPISGPGTVEPLTTVTFLQWFASGTGTYHLSICWEL